MIPDLKKWKPLEVEEIQEHLGSFEAWCLCGGRSLDWLLGRATRGHGDTDIGVFRSDLLPCLEGIGASRVFVCEPAGGLTPWDGAELPDGIHDIWITDPGGQHWILQVMVYDDIDDYVVYRRDARIRWSKSSHAITARGVRVLNPLVTMLFKMNRAELEEKDCRDIQILIEESANKWIHDIGENSTESRFPREEIS